MLWLSDFYVKLPLLPNEHSLTLQLEIFLAGHDAKLPLPPTDGDDTIFEYLVNEQGQWEHWADRVRDITNFVTWFGGMTETHVNCNY